MAEYLQSRNELLIKCPVVRYHPPPARLSLCTVKSPQRGFTMQSLPALLMFYSCSGFAGPDCVSWTSFFFFFPPTLFVVSLLEQNNALQCLPSNVYCGADSGADAH